jgi:hypothetical protein
VTNAGIIKMRATVILLAVVIGPLTVAALYERRIQ